MGPCRPYRCHCPPWCRSFPLLLLPFPILHLTIAGEDQEEEINAESFTPPPCRHCRLLLAIVAVVAVVAVVVGVLQAIHVLRFVCALLCSAVAEEDDDELLSFSSLPSLIPSSAGDWPYPCSVLWVSFSLSRPYHHYVGGQGGQQHHIVAVLLFLVRLLALVVPMLPLVTAA